MKRTWTFSGPSDFRRLAAALCVAWVLLLTLSARAQQRLLSTHHARQVVVTKQAPLVGLLPESQRLKLAIMLPLSNQAGLDAFLKQAYDPQSPLYHQWISVAQFTERFGPSQADYDAVIAFAKANGMTVTATPANRMVVDVEAAAGQINSAFHVTMRVYQHPTENRTFYAPDREPTVDLNVQLWHIAGLDNYSLPHSALRYAAPGGAHTAIAGSGPGGTYLGSDIRAAYYGGTALTGAGQTIGLYGLNYNLSDVELYFSAIGQPFNPSQVTNYSTDGTVSTCPDNCDDGEPAVDIQQALSMAPAANIVEYFGSTDADVYEAAATADIAKQMSASYLWLPADASTDEPIFEEMAAQGQSLFAASGDSGAYNATTNPSYYPADDPYITGVGGTDLTTNGAGGPWESETAWIGSSGGIDDNGIATPSYQQLSGVINASNQGSTTLRNIPDVSADANTDSFWCSSGACYEGIGGTSLAAPRWAGFMALVNQQAANNNEPPVGFLNPIIYPIGLGSSYGTDFHDITSGNNCDGNDGAGGVCFNAVTGYDLVTGWGSPNGQGLIDALTPASTAPYYTLSATPSTVTIPATGGDGTSTIQLTSGNGFTGTVTLSAAVVGPASGVTVNFNPTTVTGSGTSTMTVSTTNAISGNLQVVVSGASTASGVLTQPAYVTIVTPGYTVSSSQSTIYLNQSGTATSTITVTPQSNFNATVTLSASDLPTGVNGTFNPTSTTNASATSTLTLTAGSSAQTTLGTQFSVTGTSGSITQSAGPTVVVSAATGTGGSGTPVSLTSAYNVNGIYTDGTSFTTKGLDGDGNAYSSNLLTANRILNGIQFNFGPANAPDAVQGTGQTITLPAGQDTALLVLGTAINGPQAAQTITVTYTDGTTSIFTQGFGDWASGLGGFANESEAVGMPYFNLSASNGGGKGSGQRNLYFYEFFLNNAKTVASLTLPNNPNVLVLAATLTTQNVGGTQASLSGEYNIAGLFTNGTTFPANAGMDGGGDGCTLSSGCADAYSSQQLGLTSATPPSLTFNSLLFNFGTVNTVDCTTACILDAIDLNPGTTITLPSNQEAEYSTMTLLGTGVQGGGTATVTINYTTGSPDTFTQIFSDWCNYASNANETIAVGKMSRINSDGTLNTNAACNLYAYTYPVDATRTVESVALANATGPFQTIAFALTLTPSSASSAAGFTLSDSPSTLSVNQGSSGTSTITVNPTGGFTGSVTLAASGLPSGVTASFGTNPTTGGSVLTLTASSTATTGLARVTITGTSGSLSATNTIALTVAAAPTFTISGTPVTVAPGASTGNTSTITITPSEGFTGSVTLTAVITSHPVDVLNAPTLSFGSTSPVRITGTTARDGHSHHHHHGGYQGGSGLSRAPRSTLVRSQRCGSGLPAALRPSGTVAALAENARDVRAARNPRR